MLIVDAALAKRAAAGRPLQVALFGAGFMAKGIVNQVLRYTPGMRIAAICNRTPSAAIETYLKPVCRRKKSANAPRRRRSTTQCAPGNSASPRILM